MVEKQSPAFVGALVVTLLLFAATTPMVHGQLLPLPPLNKIIVNGLLCCTATGTCPAGGGGTPLSGVPVSLLCNFFGNTVTLGQNTTNATGAFNINVPNLLQSIGSLPTTLLGGTVLPISTQCVVKVNTTIISQTMCPVLNTVTDIIVAVPTLSSNVIPLPTGLPSIFKAGVFISIG